ncbi:MAG: hypothetical protein AAF215_31490 [Cyanobacteria bacterium P01_A01_bin.123]
MIQTITIKAQRRDSFDRGWQPWITDVQGVIIGPFCVHTADLARSGVPHGYSVTHIETGLRASLFCSRKWAIKCAKSLTQHFDWSNPALIKGQEHRVRACISHHQSKEDLEFPDGYFQ